MCPVPIDEVVIRADKFVAVIVSACLDYGSEGAFQSLGVICKSRSCTDLRVIPTYAVVDGDYVLELAGSYDYVQCEYEDVL